MIHSTTGFNQLFTNTFNTWRGRSRVGVKVILTREQSGFESNNVRTVRNERCRIVFRLSKCFSGEKKNLTGTLHIFGFFWGGAKPQVCVPPSDLY